MVEHWTHNLNVTGLNSGTSTRAQCYKTLYVRNLQIFVKAKVFVPAKLFQPCLMFVVKARRLPRVEHLKDGSLR
jgi:hypothetical protein